MKTMPVPYCCGVDFLYEFLYTIPSLTVEQVNNWLEAENEHSLAKIKSHWEGTRFTENPMHGNRPIKLLILSNFQNNYMADSLLKMGFKLIAEEKNTNSQGKIFFYLKNIGVEYEKSKRKQK